MQDVAGILLQGLGVQQVAAAIGGGSQEAARPGQQEGGARLLHGEAPLWAQQRQRLHQLYSFTVESKMQVHQCKP